MPSTEGERRKGRARALSFGLTGQMLNFIALLAPVAVASEDSLVHFVLVSSVCTASFTTAILAVPMRYPSIRGALESSVALKASLISLFGISSTLVLAGVLAGAFFESKLFGFLAAVGALLLFQGADNVMIAWMVRQDNAIGIGHNRFRYGVVNVVVTPVVAFLWGWRWALVVAACVVYCFAIVWVGWTHRRRLLASLREAWQAPTNAALTYVARSVVPAGSYLLNGIGSQAAGIALGAVGVFAEPWAVVMRIAGGFSTLSLQLVAPSFDAQIGKAVREGDHRGAALEVRKGLLIGLPLALTGGVAALAVCVFSGRGSSLHTSQWIVLSVCTLLYWGSSLAVSPIWKTLTLVGAHRARLTWDISRAIAVLVTVVTLKDGPLLVSLSCVIAAFNIALVSSAVFATRYRAKSRGLNDPFPEAGKPVLHIGVSP